MKSIIVNIKNFQDDVKCKFVRLFGIPTPLQNNAFKEVNVSTGIITGECAQLVVTTMLNNATLFNSIKDIIKEHLLLVTYNVTSSLYHPIELVDNSAVKGKSVDDTSSGRSNTRPIQMILCYRHTAGTQVIILKDLPSFIHLDHYGNSLVRALTDSGEAHNVNVKCIYDRGLVLYMHTGARTEIISSIVCAKTRDELMKITNNLELSYLMPISVVDETISGEAGCYLPKKYEDIVPIEISITRSHATFGKVIAINNLAEKLINDDLINAIKESLLKRVPGESRIHEDQIMCHNIFTSLIMLTVETTIGNDTLFNIVADALRDELGMASVRFREEPSETKEKEKSIVAPIKVKFTGNPINTRKCVTISGLDKIMLTDEYLKLLKDRLEGGGLAAEVGAGVTMTDDVAMGMIPAAEIEALFKVITSVTHEYLGKVIGDNNIAYRTPIILVDEDKTTRPLKSLNGPAKVEPIKIFFQTLSGIGRTIVTIKGVDKATLTEEYLNLLKDQLSSTGLAKDIRAEAAEYVVFRLDPKGEREELFNAIAEITSNYLHHVTGNVSLPIMFVDKNKDEVAWYSASPILAPPDTEKEGRLQLPSSVGMSVETRLSSNYKSVRIYGLDSFPEYSNYCSHLSKQLTFMGAAVNVNTCIVYPKECAKLIEVQMHTNLDSNALISLITALTRIYLASVTQEFKQSFLIPFYIK